MERTFTDKNLYAADGKPHSSDVAQDDVPDCFLAGALGAVADQQPEQIRIAYDAKTTQFTVSLFKSGKLTDYPVTQSELRDDIKRRGASTYDNRGSGPLWPAVIEAAYAKSLDSNPGDGIAEGWAQLNKGGKPIDAMYALAGDAGELFGQGAADRLGTAQSFQKLRNALAQGRPITLNTQAEWGPKKDGLVNDHSYMVQSAFVDKKGDARLKLRNPWGANITNSEGAEPASIKLDDLLRSGSLVYFNIGPARATQTQSQPAAGSNGEKPMSLREVVDLLNDLAQTGSTQALRESPAGKEFRMQGQREANLSAVQLQNEGMRATVRLSEGRTQRIGM